MHMECYLILLASEPVSPFVGGRTCFFTTYWYAQIVLTLVIFIYPSHLHTYHIFCNGNKLFSISSSGKYEEKPFFSFPPSSALTQCNNTLRIRQKPVNNHYYHLKCTSLWTLMSVVCWLDCVAGLIDWLVRKSVMISENLLMIEFIYIYAYT